MILEVGLGGRLDAVNAIDADCAIITSIDLDHTEYLGADRESIGREKAGSHARRAGRRSSATRVPPASVIDHARDMGADLWLVRPRLQLPRRPPAMVLGRPRPALQRLAYPALRGANQLLNASGVLAAFEALRQRLPVTRAGGAPGPGDGRAAGPLPDRAGPADAGAGRGAQPARGGGLADNLDQMGFYPRTHAVFGAMRDKDIAAMLAPHGAAGRPLALAPTCPRRARRARPSWPTLRARCAGASRAGGASPRMSAPIAALRAALAAADPADRIVVFGSFFTVGGVLKDGLPRLAAQHAA